MTTPARPGQPPPQAPARRRSVGSRLPRAAEQERGEQEERRRAQRPSADHRHLLQARFRLHRPGRPAGPDALVRALHPAQARDRRRQDRDPGAGGARRPLLHAPGPDRRRPAQPGAAARHRRHLQHYGRGTADVTDRQNIQLHWIEIEAVPDIWERLESVGLSTTEACGDTPRVILGLPARRDRRRRGHRRRPSRSARSTTRYIGNPAFSNLPRKFKSALSGCPAHCTVHEINDVAFVGVVNEQGEKGYDLWVGGGLSTNPMLGQAAGRLRPTPEQVARRLRRRDRHLP